jgi:hypothetical protein
LTGLKSNLEMASGAVFMDAFDEDEFETVLLK